jgi:hypothetical protein
MPVQSVWVQCVQSDTCVSFDMERRRCSSLNVPCKEFALIQRFSRSSQGLRCKTRKAEPFQVGSLVHIRSPGSPAPWCECPFACRRLASAPRWRSAARAWHSCLSSVSHSHFLCFRLPQRTCPPTRQQGAHCQLPAQSSAASGQAQTLT